MDVTVTDVPERNRYEARTLGGDLAGFVQYRRADPQIVVTHTVVEPAYEGQGVGSTLARNVLDDARRQQLSVVPQCSFVRGWIEKHSDYAGLVAQDR